MTRALILGLALFCGKLMADPCDDMLVQTAGAQAQKQAVYDASQQQLNGWTPVATGSTVVEDIPAGTFHLLRIQVPIELTYLGQPNSYYTTYEYWMTANLLNRNVSFSTQAELDYAANLRPPPPPTFIEDPLPVADILPVVTADQLALDFASQYAEANSSLFNQKTVLSVLIESETPMGFVSQFQFRAILSNGDTIRITFQVDGNGNVIHLGTYLI